MVKKKKNYLPILFLQHVGLGDSYLNYRTFGNQYKFYVNWAMLILTTICRVVLGFLFHKNNLWEFCVFFKYGGYGWNKWEYIEKFNHPRRERSTIQN